jgi:hypothetical protein
MSAPGVTLQGFAYGEYLDGVPPRSLGYQLQAPVEPESWSAEVETLARQLQAACYPDQWPPAECFCSVLLGDGRRVVAVARYGRSDHTVSHRRGGLELIGVLGPGELDGATALGIYRWLCRRQPRQTDLQTLGGRYDLSEIVAGMPSSSPDAPPEAVGVWQEQPLLLAALSPADPQRCLRFLDRPVPSGWQCLPFVGPDFPFSTYAARGPLVGWIPFVSPGSKRANSVPALERAASRPWSKALALIAVCLLLLLLSANLWALLANRKSRLAADDLQAQKTETHDQNVVRPATTDESAAEPFARALHQLLENQQATKEWTQAQLLQEYQASVERDQRLRATSLEGKMAVGAVGALSRRSASRVEQLVREALAHKGYDDELVNLACVRIRERLARDLPGMP